ncbi:MAG TPA: hypothetical protein VK031_01450 [Tissierellaceae bacterium]|nr:hypothetical protein [Tissierellaceae bacterium]
MTLERTFINDFIDACLDDGKNYLQEELCSLGYLPFSDCSIEKIESIAKTLFDYVAPVLRDNFKPWDLRSAGGDLYIAMMYDDLGTIYQKEVWKKLTEKDNPKNVFGLSLLWFTGDDHIDPDPEHWYVEINYFTESGE